MAEDEILKKYISIVLIILLFVMAFFLVRPIIVSAVVGFIAAYIFHPIYDKLYSKIKRKNLCAFIITILAILIIAIPTLLALPMIVNQLFDVYRFMQGVDIASFLSSAFPSIFTSEVASQVSLSINSFIAKAGQLILNNLTDMLVNLPTILLNLALMLFIFYFGLRDMNDFSQYIEALLPFSKETKEEFMKKSRDVTQAVIYGQVVVGVIQGLVAGIGMLFFGVHNVLTLTLLSIFVSVIPLIGAWLVWLPVSLLLIANNQTFSGVGLFLYGAIIVSWVDNIIRPVFVSSRIKVNSALVLIGMVGGFLTIGVLGLIVGPLIIAYLLLVLEMYRNKRFDYAFYTKKEE